MVRRLSMLVPLVFVCLGAAPQQPAAPADEPLFRFGLVADVQYADKETRGARHYRGSADKLGACVADWNQRELAFAVQLGDLIDGRETLEGSREDLETVLTIFEKLQVPLHHVLGNHCFAVPRAELLPRLGLESSWYRFQRDGWRFLVLDSLDLSTCGWPAGSPRHEEATRWLVEHSRSADHPSALPYNGAVGKVQLEWLKAELVAAAAARERVVVFSHQPILAQAGDASLLSWNHAQILAVLDASPAVVALIAGHHHAGGHAVREGVHHLTMKGLVEKTEGGGDYAVVEVFPDRLELVGVGRVESRTLKREVVASNEDG